MLQTREFRSFGRHGNTALRAGGVVSGRHGNVGGATVQPVSEADTREASNNRPLSGAARNHRDDRWHRRFRVARSLPLPLLQASWIFRYLIRLNFRLQ